LIVVFFGPPGVGKGTIARLLSDRTGIPHVSTGEIFRKAISKGSALGQRVKILTESGGLAPDDVTIALVKERLELPDVADGVYLDGFPRTIAQADSLDSIMPVGRVINLVAPDDVLIERLAGRRVCRSCGNTHHLKLRPPRTAGVCDRCGKQLSQRKDDTADAVRRRLDIYHESTSNLIQHYRDRRLLTDIDASAAAEAVCSEVAGSLDVPGR